MVSPPISWNVENPGISRRQEEDCPRRSTLTGGKDCTPPTTHTGPHAKVRECQFAQLRSLKKGPDRAVPSRVQFLQQGLQVGQRFQQGLQPFRHASSTPSCLQSTPSCSNI